MLPFDLSTIQMQEMNKIPGKEDLLHAKKTVLPFVHHTPILTNQFINQLIEADIYFKCENFQKVGAFKMRGASNAIKSIKLKDAKGVITHSSGNHAQAVALSAKLMGIQAKIVMPENAPKVKVEAVRSYGAELVFCKPGSLEREKAVADIMAKEKWHFIPPFDHPDVIAGQASCAMELMEDVQGLDYMICPVGGGGLLAGTALACKYFSPKIKVFAGEPENVNDAYLSFQSKTKIENKNAKSIADGLLTNLGELNFEIIKNEVSAIFQVSEDEIIQAMRLIWERMKIIIEPSCAVPLSAMIRNKELFKDKKVGLILSGGNVDLDHFFAAIKRV